MYLDGWGVLKLFVMRDLNIVKFDGSLTTHGQIGINCVEHDNLENYGASIYIDFHIINIIIFFMCVISCCIDYVTHHRTPHFVFLFIIVNEINNS